MKKVVLVTIMGKLDQIVEELSDDAILVDDIESELIDIVLYDSVTKYSNTKYIIIPFDPNDNNTRHILNSLMEYKIGFIFAVDSKCGAGSSDNRVFLKILTEVYDEILIQARQYKMPIMKINNIKEFVEFLRNDKVFEILLEKIKGVEVYRFGSEFTDDNIKQLAECCKI